MPKPSSWWQQAQEWSPIPGSLVQRFPLRGQPADEVVSTWTLYTRAAIISAVGAGWVDSLHFGWQFHLVLEVQAVNSQQTHCQDPFLLSGMAENTWTAVLHWLCSSWGKTQSQCCSFFLTISTPPSKPGTHFTLTESYPLNYLNTDIVSMMKAGGGTELDFIAHLNYWCIYRNFKRHMGFPGGSVIKNPPTNAGDTGSIPDLGRSHMLCGTTKHMWNKYWASTPPTRNGTYWKLWALEPMFCNRRSHHNEKPKHCT